MFDEIEDFLKKLSLETKIKMILDFGKNTEIKTDAHLHETIYISQFDRKVIKLLNELIRQEMGKSFYDDFMSKEELSVFTKMLTV